MVIDLLATKGEDRFQVLMMHGEKQIAAMSQDYRNPMAPKTSFRCFACSITRVYDLWEELE
jgi:hypothetical protein